MNDICTETCCSRCMHCAVCSYKGRLLLAQKAIDNLSITEHEKDSMPVKDMAFIKPIKIDCLYFYPERTVSVRSNTMPMAGDGGIV